MRKKVTIISPGLTSELPYIVNIIGQYECCNCQIHIYLPNDFRLFFSRQIEPSDLGLLLSFNKVSIFFTPLGIQDLTLVEGTREHVDVMATSVENYEKNLIKALLLYTLEEVHQLYSRLDITPANIPQFSSLQGGTFTLLEILHQAGNFGPTFSKLGEYLLGSGRNKVAYTKYGENHAKLSSELGLVRITNKAPKKVYITPLGEAALLIPLEEHPYLLARLAARIPIIATLLAGDRTKAQTDTILSQKLSCTTAKRRRSNIIALLTLCDEYKGTSSRRTRFSTKGG